MRGGRRAVALALALAAAYFYFRGPRRALAEPDGSIDFQYCFYIAFRTFALGGNPYQPEQMLQTAGAISGRHADIMRSFYKGAILYPPGFFLLAPLGLLPLRTAVWLWLLLQCASFAALLWWAWRLCPKPAAGGLQKLVFLTCGLSLAPVHTSLAVGNTGALSAALAAGLFYALTRNCTGWAGVALGLLMSKPTFGIPAAILVALWGRWRVLAVGAAVSAAASAPVFYRLGLLQTVADWRRNLAVHTAAGMPNDGTPANPFHYQFLNLQSWWYTLAGPGWAEAWTVLVVAFLLWVLFRFRKDVQDNAASYWTLAAVFLLLSMYHVFYDAALLVVPVAALFHWHGRRPRYAWGAAVLLAPFAAPGTTLLHLKLESLAHRVPLVEAIVVRHQVVALLLLAVLATAALAADKSRFRLSAGSASPPRS